MRWRNWNWLDLILLPLFMAVMRACWLFPWLTIIQRVLLADADLSATTLNVVPVLPAGIIFAVPLLSFWLARIATARLPADEEAQLQSGFTVSMQTRFVLAVGGLLTILGVLWWHFARDVYAFWDVRWVVTVGQLLIHVEQVQSLPVWLALFTLIFLWLRGLLDAGRTMGHDDIWGAMSSGVVAIILYLILTESFDAVVPENFSNWIVVFFAAGMAALAFSGLKVTVGLNWALSGSTRNTKTPPLTRYWLISVGIVVGALLGIGIAIGLLVAPEQVARLMAMLNGVANVLWWIVSTIILALAYVVFVIVYYILKFFEPLIERLLAGMAELANLMPPAAQELPPPQEPLTATLATLPDSYRWVGLIIFLALVAIIFALVVRRLRMGREVESDEVRESILSSDLLQDQLAKLWNRLWGNRAAAGELDPYLSLEGEADTRRTIRQLYQKLLTAAGQRGLGRQKAETPREYRRNLATATANLDEPLEKITERYNHARYAPEPPDIASARDAEQSWSSIEPVLGVPPEERGK